MRCHGLGANLSSVKLRTVRNEKVEDFLALIKEWHQLCMEFGLFDEKIPTIGKNDSEDED